MQYLTKALALFLVTIAVEAAEPTEAEGPLGDVVAAVLAEHGWVVDLEQCPSAVMPPWVRKSDESKPDCEQANARQCLEACQDGEANACYWLAQALQREPGQQRATDTLFQRSCKLGVASGCTNRAAAILHLDPDSKDKFACTSLTFKLACERDDPWGCTMYGIALSRGQGVNRDLEQAKTALKKACRFDEDDKACVSAKNVRKKIDAEVSGKPLAVPPKN